MLTDGDGTHAIEFSPDRRVLHRHAIRASICRRSTELRRADGRQAGLRAGDAPTRRALVEAGWKPPERFVAKGRDGKTDIYGVIFRPTNFDPTKKYPVIEHIYAGPQDSFVPKAFTSLSRAAERWPNSASSSCRSTAWARTGGARRSTTSAGRTSATPASPTASRGSSGRGEVSRRWTSTRVGIYGGSAGGQSALGRCWHHGDFYKVAVADCGCHDNRMDKIWWNELWMGWPVGPHYAEQSNVTQAHKLKGKLLLIVGELDQQRRPRQHDAGVDALIKADKDFDLIVIPGGGHGAAETPYGRRRRAGFLRAPPARRRAAAA